MSEAFVCSVCGQTHEGLPTQWAWKLPDLVWAIPEGDRESAADFTEDVCAYDGRFFIRCVLPIPFTHQADFFGWGVWAEVGRSTFLRYLDLYEADGSTEPPLPGTLANVISLYGAPLGQPVLIQFGTASERPMLRLTNDDMSPLAREQRAGMGADRHHEILKALGAL
ncbi:DUF2199 domain-containing protein [Nitrospirillum viridazoti]|uniref:DUF2199 domain-containing protein n=1 Tax=Nitrospirillum viridazoti CBAmc TaxID=1441467 RepID=A0A248JR94_9PROT|nr:DUF2199 domain-containing protein [Nitrospirillum amazonense]ASG21225.1 hypothetical protein Y958_10615 [Nitrospirillum amazonense CBAmc]TWB32220.1 hypothetical protein FBZ91_11869 [Nitrospirillum amazonense]